jgi:deoxycytidylate deaminase
MGNMWEMLFICLITSSTNTVDRLNKDGSPNPEWDVTEKLSRLVKIVTHSELARPLIAETAMYHAAGTQMQSACLSRQVGAAVVDINGNLIATGTNEAPKAGVESTVSPSKQERRILDVRCLATRLNDSAETRLNRTSSSMS